MALFLALLVRRAETDDGLAADQRRLLGVLAGSLDGGLDLVGIVAVDIADDLPAVRLETLGRVVGKPAFHFTVDGDAVVVVEGDQLAQTQGACQRGHFVGDAFHHAAVAEEHVGVVVNHLVPFTVELSRQHLLGNRHAHGIGNALPQRAGGGFNTRGVAVFGVAGGFAVQLTEVFDVVDADVIAGQVQQGVDQHGAVTVGQHKAVAVGKVGVGRVVLQIVTPQDFGDIRHTHGRTGVAAVGFLHGIHAEGTNGIGTVTTTGHEQLLWLARRGLSVGKATGREKEAGIFAQSAVPGNENPVSAALIPSLPDERPDLYQSILI